MADEYKTVDLWVGRFRDETALEAFFADRYDNDATPISEFANSQGERFYNHDFLETSFGDSSTSLRARVDAHSFGESFSAAAEARYQSLNSPRFNGIVLRWNNEIDQPKSVRLDGGELIYIGRFPCLADD